MMQKSANYIEKSFLPVLIAFNIAGMETLPCPELFKHNYLLLNLWNFPSYLWALAQILCALFQLLFLVILPDKKMTFSVTLLILLQGFSNYSVYRSRKLILVILKKISTVMKMLPYNKRPKFKTAILAYFVFVTVLVVSFMLLFYPSGGYLDIKEEIFSSPLISSVQAEYVTILLNILSGIMIIVLLIVCTSSTAFYGFVCLYIVIFNRELRKQIQNIRENYDDYGSIIDNYLKICNIMELLEDCMCVSVFALVVYSVIGLFWMCYGIIFLFMDGYQYYLCAFIGQVFYSMVIGMVIFPASAANNASYAAKEAVRSLPGRIPKHYNEIKIILRRECKQRIALTLGRIYEIDKSLLISIIGVLMNYGILVATLGTVKDSDVK
ncbi:uncharacterized protein NPIL_455671 [Nephila pilipes]|uniref:Gustatory receptor n=1 Tax=Nephila pilipes TaxID=299642 RepID=A0A8X6QJI6_NEPPI|nr:uncharacterized protein NPIL_455671 [Nephila pilipes]